MKKLTTKDGSITYHNENYDETYHSTSGALEESFEKFAKPANLKNHMNILDICFGLGYNSLAALSIAHVNIIALENDQAILKKIKENKIFENTAYHPEYNGKLIENKTIVRNYEIIKQAAENKNNKSNKSEVKIIIGDARNEIKHLVTKFDVVFLDPFSPKKCPELWTKEFFKDIYNTMKDNSILTTYSCAGSVRKNLEEVGFKVSDGPIIGRRSPATIAKKAKNNRHQVVSFPTKSI